jgi:ArsR family transcriptional regulator
VIAIKSLRTRARPVLGEEQSVELAEMFRLLGEVSRLRIVLACLREPTSVGAIAERVGLANSLVSHHLRLLRAARLLRAERHGKQVFYSLADEHVRRVIEDMVDHVVEPSERDEED